MQPVLRIRNQGNSMLIKVQRFLKKQFINRCIGASGQLTIIFIINFDLTCDLYSVVLSEVVFPLERLLQKGTADTEEE